MPQPLFRRRGGIGGPDGGGRWTGRARCPPRRAPTPPGRRSAGGGGQGPASLKPKGRGSGRHPPTQVEGAEATNTVGEKTPIFYRKIPTRRKHLFSPPPNKKEAWCEPASIVRHSGPPPPTTSPPPQKKCLWYKLVFMENAAFSEKKCNHGTKIFYVWHNTS